MKTAMQTPNGNDNAKNEKVDVNNEGSNPDTGSAHQHAYRLLTYDRW